MNSLFDLSGKTALITGGSKGLGKEMARVFAQHGATLIIASRHEEELQSALKDILRDTNSEGFMIAADLAIRADVERLAKEALEKTGSVDILVNNAGSNTPQDIAEVVDETFDEIVQVSQHAPMALVRALAPRMKEKRWGRIISISSIMAEAPLAKRTAYAATRAAICGMARAWAQDLGHYGITSNVIMPGPFLTELPARVTTPEQKALFTSHTILKRWGDPTEMAGPALFLASNASSYVTGEVLRVDGGYLSA